MFPFTRRKHYLFIQNKKSIRKLLIYLFSQVLSDRSIKTFNKFEASLKFGTKFMKSWYCKEKRQY